MNFRIAGALLSLSLLASAATASAEKPWSEVRSPHFRVLSDGSSADARRVAHEFEQMRYVFATDFPQFRLDSGAPLTIFAARDEETAKSLEPYMWKSKGPKPAGIFHHGWEKQYVMVRLDATGLSPRMEVYHEYTHSILHLNAHWLPTWLDEGMAEFYGYTRFQDKKIYIGAPSVRAPLLHETPIPIEDLMTPSKVRAFYRDPDRANMFYAESWALVHYLTFGPNMEYGAKLNRFFALTQQGQPQKQAFQQVFGNFADVNNKFDIYIRAFAFNAAVLKDPPQIDEKTFTVKKLTMAETYAELAGYHLWTHDLTHAQPLVDKALKEDPKLGLAHEEEGFLLFSYGKDGVAADEFSQAYNLDSTLYLSLFAKTMLSPIASMKTSADQAAFGAAMDKVATINSQFAPAYVQLARLAVRQNNLQQAFGLSRRAEELEPWRAGYHLLTGQILLRMGKGAEAAGYAQYVAAHWFGPDHDEAVELWNRIPPTQRPAGVTLVDQTPQNTQTVRGTVQSVTCGEIGADGKRTPPTLVLAHDGRPLTFLMNGPVAGGFSDTLWWGEDHFSPCRHLDGLRAVVRYRPAADAKYAGDIVELSVLDDLPATVSAKDVPAQSAAQ
ncbi:MAG: hypothetical protein WA708_12965 [Acidobacteriaceae bacterium]